MPRYIQYLIALSAIALSSCTLKEGVDVGESCPNWTAYYELGSVSCVYPNCSLDHLDAYMEGRCPGRNTVCSLNNEKQRICRQKCEPGYAMCNDACIPESDFKENKIITTIDGLKFCEDKPAPDVTCLNGKDDKGKCICSEECPDTCASDGSCKCSENCLYGCDEKGACQCNKACADSCNEDGSCLCRSSCKNGCNEDGSCKCFDECEDECNKDGSCACDSACPKTCDEHGACLCSTTCPDGCNRDGSCICNPACPNSCNDDGSCVCKKECTNGCNPNGTCICNAACPDDCNKTTGNCQCNPACPTSCKEDGACECPSSCQFGCDEAGACLPDRYIQTNPPQKDIQMLASTELSIAVGIMLGGKFVDNHDLKIDVKYAPSATEQCITVPDEIKSTSNQDDNNLKISAKAISARDCKAQLIISEKDETGSHAKAVAIDVTVVNRYDDNQNHMIDFYETAPKKGTDCENDSVCESSTGAKDGFCDSFVGYQCSTRCTSDDQCMKSTDERYNFVCRNDGRCAPDAFITKWKIHTDEANLTKNAVIPLYAKSGAVCDFTVDWGDGSTPEKVTKCETVTHEYKPDTKEKEYTVTVKGKIDGFGFPKPNPPHDDKWINHINGCGYKSSVEHWEDMQNLREVITFGPVGLGIQAFHSASNIHSLSSIDIPDSTLLTDLTAAFSNVGPSDNEDAQNKKITSYLSRWDVSNVTSMAFTFSCTNYLVDDISKWNTSKVTSMRHMFYHALNFNGAIGDWDTSKVNNMSYMFAAAREFDADISKWNTSNVTTMYMMFAGVDIIIEKGFYNGYVKFNKNITGWNTSNVENMAYMFHRNNAFNQGINLWKDRVKNVTDMHAMFKNATEFNQNLSNWELNQTQDINMSEIFDGSKMSHDNLCSFQNICPESSKKYINVLCSN